MIRAKDPYVSPRSPAMVARFAPWLGREDIAGLDQRPLAQRTNDRKDEEKPVDAK